MENLRGGTVNLERFWARVKKTATCWLWLGAKRDVKQGYGMVQVTVESARGPAFRTEAAHRISFELSNGPIPLGSYVLHSCDTRECVNPAHLRLGTHDENMGDKVARGRGHGSFLQTLYRPTVESRRPVVIRSRIRKLTSVQARDARTRYAAGGVTAVALAREYRISKPMMIGVLTGRWYRDAGGPINTIRAMVGENAPWAKWTNQQVKEIREKHANGQTQRALAAEYGADKQTISDFVRGTRWVHVPGPRMTIRAPHRKLTKSEVLAIRQARVSGETCARIAARFGICTATVSLIARRVHHADI